jgi:diacylglycerol kinase (ATP)
MRIDVIVNTSARLYTRSPERLEKARRACRGVAELHLTQSLSELDAACAAIASRGTDLVILSGGDGSFMAGVTALSRALSASGARLPKIALLPGGTVATVARNWGFSGDPEAHLAEILDHRASLRTAVRPTLRVSASPVSSTSPTNERERSYIGFIFGTGLVAKFFEVYYAEGAGGYAGSARIVARIFAESFIGGAYARRVLDPLPCSLSVDGRTLEPTAWSLICAAVVRDLGIHMLVTYRAGEDLDRPHLVASPLPSRALGPRAPLVLAGKRIGGPGHFDDLVRELTIRFDPEGPFVLDGDILRAREVRVTAGPAIEVVLPPPRR